MEKYKFTGETKQHFGRTLYQIVAIVSFGSVAAGEIGGWIEAESNLSHEGNAWVYGDARVYGNAWVYGNAQVYGNAGVSGDARVTPVFIGGLTYTVTIIDTHIQIGCQYHSAREWDAFDDRAILDMDGKAALKFWRAHKEHIMGIARVMRPDAFAEESK